MLMPPQQPQDQQVPPPPTPTSPAPQYDFIYNNPQPKKRFGLRLPSNNLSKLTMLIVGGGVVLAILIIVLSSVFGGKGVDTRQLVDIAAQAKEISRVSAQVAKQSRDLNTANLAATTQNSMDGEQTQITSYLKSAHKKYSTKDLNIHLDKNVDSELQTAVQNNRVSTFYGSYLKKHLGTYQNSLKTAFGSTSSAKLKPILQEAFASNKVILSTSVVTTAP